MGRRRHLVGVARHDLQRMLERGQVECGPEVERVQQILDQALITDSAEPVNLIEAPLVEIY